jgi:predicted AlkP superfamily phosphohydrolase/phosphomutase
MIIIRTLIVLTSVLLLTSYGVADWRQDADFSATVLISFDGAQPGVIERLLKTGKLARNGGFAKLISEGTKAEGMTMILPTVTATNHIALATGAYVEQTNIPANTFHDTEVGITTTTSGFGAPIGAETLWEAAKRQGKKVITIAFAGADGRGDDRRGDKTLGFGVVDAFSVIKSMNGSHFDSDVGAGWNLGAQRCEFRKGNIGAVTANQVFFSSQSLGRVDVNVLACDSISDGQERYDTLFFDFDKDLANGFIAALRQGESAPFALPLTVPADAAFPDFARGQVGSWVKLLALAADLSTVRIYLGNMVHNVGYPQSFIDEIDKSIGFWPAEPDFFNLERGNIDEETYMEQLERLADYLKNAMLLAIRNHKFDLLMGYQVQTDEAGHEFSLVDPRQQSFEDTAKRERYAEYLERSYQIADRNLKEIIDAVKLKETNVIAVSDHGMAPMHTFAFPNRILRAAGLLSVTATGSVDAATSMTNAVTVGGATNIYINLQGREPTGIVPLEQYETVQQQIADAFKAIRDPVTNEHVFEIILKKPRAEDMLRTKSNFGDADAKKRRGGERDFHAFGEDSGDVLVVAIPGYHLDFNAGTASSIGSFFQPSTFFGQHGHDPRRPEMKAIFYAAGPRFRRKTLNDVDAVDIAPTVAELLDIKPPRDAQGKKIRTGNDHAPGTRPQGHHH